MPGGDYILIKPIVIMPWLFYVVMALEPDSDLGGLDKLVEGWCIVEVVVSRSGDRLRGENIEGDVSLGVGNKLAKPEMVSIQS